MADEILRRSLSFDSGPLVDEQIGSAAAALFQSLDEEDAAAIWSTGIQLTIVLQPELCGLEGKGLRIRIAI